MPDKKTMKIYVCSNGHRESYPSKPKKCPICKCPMDEEEKDA